MGAWSYLYSDRLGSTHFLFQPSHGARIQSFIPMKHLLPLIVVLFIVSSCSITRTTVGNGPIGRKPTNRTFSQTKQMYLFAGLIKLGTFQPRKPDHTNYQVKTCNNFVDGLISFGTAGIITTRTIKIIVGPSSKEVIPANSYRDSIGYNVHVPVLELTKRGNKVYVDGGSPEFISSLTGWSYWTIVSNKEEADFIMIVKSMEIVFKNKSGNEFMRTCKTISCLKRQFK